VPWPLGLPTPIPAALFPPQPVNNADFIIPVEIDGVVHQVRGRGRRRRRRRRWAWHLRSRPQVLPTNLKKAPRWDLERCGMAGGSQRGCETCPRPHKAPKPWLIPTCRQWVPFPSPGLLSPLAPPARDPVQVIQDRLCAVQPVLHYLARGPVLCGLGVRGLTQTPAFGSS
jgi:hypothetical protein